MIRSMTAYAGTELTTGRIGVNVEIRGYNSRNLDITLRIPPTYQFLEEKIRPRIAERISRGRIEVKLFIQSADEAPEDFQINESLAEGYYGALKKLKERFNVVGGVPLSLLAEKNGIIEPVQTEIDPDAIWTSVSKALYQALDEFIGMKTTEGHNIAKDIEARIETIGGHIREIEQRSAGLLEAYQQRLKERIQALTQGMVDIDAGRIAQEAAFLADKSDISEETVRAKSHLDQFGQLMRAPEPAGRPLNFLLQEFSREFNTMGSKAGNADISHVIVSAKTELEKIREQVQNIE